MTKIVLVRHGQTDWNLNRRIQGSTDIPLNDTGRADALAAAEALRGEHFDGIIASPLSRALDTARIIATELELGEPGLLDTIVERHYGDAEGLTGEELFKRFPDRNQVPGRETWEKVTARVVPALAELAEANPDKSLIVVTHGGVIGALLRHITDGALPLPAEVIANGSAHVFYYRDGSLQVDRDFEGAGPRDVVTAAVS